MSSKWSGIFLDILYLAGFVLTAPAAAATMESCFSGRYAKITVVDIALVILGLLCFIIANRINKRAHSRARPP